MLKLHTQNNVDVNGNHCESFGEEVKPLQLLMEWVLTHCLQAHSFLHAH